MLLPPSVDLSKIPFVQPPAGVTSNFINPPSLRNAVIIVQAVFLTLMLGFVTLRIYTRGFLTRSLGWDDYTCVLAAMGSVVHGGLLIHQIQHGYGTHSWDIPLSVLTPAVIRTLLALPIVAWLTALFMKLSLLLLYLRIFGVERNFRYIIYFLMAVDAFFYLGSTGVALGSLFLCTIEPTGSRSFCAQNYKLAIAQSVFGLASDFLVLGIPITRVWRSQLSSRRKIGVIGVFMTGFIACIADVTDMTYVIPKIDNPDVFYRAALASIYGCVATNLGIISGAMVCLPAFYQKSHLKEFSLSTWALLRSWSLSNKSRKMNKNSSEKEGSSPMPPNVNLDGFHVHEIVPRGQKKIPRNPDESLLLSSPSSLESQSHNLVAAGSISDERSKNPPSFVIRTGA